MKAAAAALLFYMLPLLVGAALLSRRRPLRLPAAWMAGSLALTAAVAGASGLSAAGLLGDAGRTLLLRMLLALAMAWGLFGGGARSLVSGLPPLPRLQAASALLAWLAALLVFRHDSPPPALLNWDLLQHLTLVQQMERGAFHFSLVRYSDSFTLDTYAPFYHVALYAARLVLPAPAPEFCFALDALHQGTVAFAAALLAWRLWARPWATFWATLLAAWVFETYVAYSAMFHMPQTVVGLLFALCLGEVLAPGPHGPPSRGQLLAWAAFLALGHFLVGPPAAALLLLAAEARARPRRPGPLATVLAGVAAVALVVAVHALATYDPFDTPESRSQLFSLATRVHLLRGWTGGLALLVPLALAVVARRRERTAADLAAAGLLAAAGVLLPVPYTLKLAVVAHLPLALLGGYGLGALFEAVADRRLQAVAAAAWAGALLVALQLNLHLNFKQWIGYRGQYSLASPAEIEAAAALRALGADAPDVLLVSEPATQNVLEGFGGVNTPGGAVATPATRARLAAMVVRGSGRLEVASPEVVAHALAAVYDGLAPPPRRRLLAVSGRFFDWEALGAEERAAPQVNVWRPRDLSPAEWALLRGLRSSPAFRTLYQNAGLVVLELL